MTLGCSKNLVDSENIVTQLRANHIHAEHEQPGEADIVIINTCGFIEAAKQESIDTILHFENLKKKGEISRLYVTGCLSQRYKHELETSIPLVDAYFGTLELPALLKKFNADYKHELIGEKQILTPPHYAYLKISEGCNRTCSFCAIPLMRGKHVSKPMDGVIQEAKNLVSRGVKEIILIAQELTYYGLDLYKRRTLADLLSRLAKIESLEWIRLHYAYPANFPLEIFDVMADHDNICNYIDMPLQHADNEILKRMKRHVTEADAWKIIEYARSKVPNLAFRTTMLVGFPGETEIAFDKLCRFVEAAEFDRLGVFEYSHEEGTSAMSYHDDVPAQLKEKRAATLMNIQQRISLSKNERKVGSKLKVLIDRKEGDHFYGRTEFDSPEVDNEVIVDARQGYARIGDFSQVRIVEATEYDLYGIFENK